MENVVMEKNIQMENIQMEENAFIECLEELKGCTITSVDNYGSWGDDAFSLDCKDKVGNRLVLVILADGSWLFHDSKRYPKKKLTIEQFGNIAKLSEYSKVESVIIGDHPDNEGVQIVITVYDEVGTDRALADIKDIFPMLVVSEGKGSLENGTHPVFICSDHDYFLEITIAARGRALSM